MSLVYPDSSFLCALYVQQVHSPRAIAYLHQRNEPLPLTSFVVFEFLQSIRLQAWLFEQNHRKGFPSSTGQLAVNRFEEHRRAGLYVGQEYDWTDVLEITSRLSAAHTARIGCRAMDMFHVAIALHLGAREFLTFDANQKKLAEAEGLKTPF